MGRISGGNQSDESVSMQQSAKKGKMAFSERKSNQGGKRRGVLRNKSCHIIKRKIRGCCKLGGLDISEKGTMFRRLDGGVDSRKRGQIET